MIKQGRVAEAIVTLTKAAQLTPHLPEAPYNLGGILWQQGYLREAMVAYREALRRRPQWPQVAHHLAWLLITQAAPAEGEVIEAIALAERACHATNFRNPVTLRTLAAAYHAAGQHLAAVQVAQLALSHLNAARDPGLAAKIQEQIQNYQTVLEGPQFP
jgi:tetratricopeptide (TPR) repeat protein